MTFERIVGLNVTDETEYQRYRDRMLPILESYGGSFGFDLQVSEVLQSKTNEPINRVFTIEFPDRQTMDRFFADPTYLQVRSRHFEKAVSSVTIISLHDKPM